MLSRPILGIRCQEPISGTLMQEPFSVPDTFFFLISPCEVIAPAVSERYDR